MKQIKFPHFYIVIAKDTDGNIWSFDLEGFDYKIDRLQSVQVIKAEDIPQYTEKAAKVLIKVIDKAPQEFWDQSMEDDDEDEDKVTLKKSSVKLYKVLSEALPIDRNYNPNSKS